MDTRLKLLIIMIFITLICGNSAEILDTTTYTGRSSSTLLNNGLSRAIQHIYTLCADESHREGDLFWCFKVQGAKLLGRALKVQNINIFDGLTIIKRLDNETRTGRASATDINLNNKDLEKLSTKSLDSLLYERFVRFIQSRQLQVNLPRLLVFGQRNSQSVLQPFIEPLVELFTTTTKGMLDTEDSQSEGRKKKDDKKYLGPFIAAVFLKAAILKMAYHSIAIVAGKALIVGKIALIISAIIGLKKLVSHEGGEKTTYEIVKHPQVQQSHTYSSSHTGEYEGGHESGGGSYHRSMDDEMMMQDKAYHGWMPANAS